MKYFLSVAIITASLLYACNVRKHDQVADEKGLRAERALQDSLGKINTEVEVNNSTHDFGTIKQGDKVTDSFSFKNIGKNPLVITDARPSCGCTIAEKPGKPVMPGETSFIKIVFNSTGKHGFQEKVITVTANTTPPIFKLTLTGQIEGEEKDDK